VHAADAYSRSSTKVGVRTGHVRTGPVTTRDGIATAYMTRCRWWCSPARCPRMRIGQDAFQEMRTPSASPGVRQAQLLVRT